MALCAMGRRCLSPARPQVTGGLLPAPSSFPFLMDLIHSFSFVRDEKLGKPVHEWAKP